MEKEFENINENKDLEFIPFDTKDNIFNSDANWFPVIRLNTATVDTITNQFITGFSNPITRSTIDREKFNNIVYNKDDKYKKEQSEDEKVESFNILDNLENVEIQSEKRKIENNLDNKNVNNSNKSSKKSKGKSYDKNRKEEKDGRFNEPPHMKILREYNLLYLEEESRLETVSLTDDIYKEMMEENQEILDVLKAYEIPKPIVDIIVKKIIRITLDNCSRE